MDQRCIADFDTDFSSDNEIPSRPTSRLSFNRAMIDSPPFTEEEISEELCSESCSVEHEPNCPFLIRLGRANHTHEDDITSLTHEHGDSYTFQLSPLLPSQSMAPGSSSSSEVHTSSEDEEDSDAEYDSDCSSCEDSDEDSPSLPCSSDLPSNPIHTASTSDCVARTRFSCLPSPLSPHHICRRNYEFHITPPRHRYHHHGHSRQALHHLKWFWAAREDEWIEHKARLCESRAYDGLSVFKHLSPGRNCVSNAVNTPPPHHTQLLPPMTIHPRRGDLCALRDPYCAHIDRYFVGMPLWTMAKTLWMFDVHTGSDDGTQFVTQNPEAVSQPREAEDDLYDEDDSDSTLVESESDGDISSYGNGSRELGDETLNEGVEIAKKESNAPSESKSCPLSDLDPGSSSSKPSRKIKMYPDLFIGYTTTSSPKSSTSSKLNTANAARPRWVTSWYRRWEILMQLCIESEPYLDCSTPSLPTTVPPAASAHKSQKFFFAEDETWSHILTEEEDDDESGNTANVLVVVNSHCEDSTSYQTHLNDRF